MYALLNSHPWWEVDIPVSGGSSWLGIVLAMLVMGAMLVAGVVLLVMLRRQFNLTWLVGIDPKEDRATIKRVKFINGRYEWDDGENRVDINLPQSFTYPSQTGQRLVIADVTTGDAIRLKAEAPGRLLQDRPTGAFLRAVRQDSRMGQMAGAQENRWGWVSKYAGLIVVLTLGLMGAILALLIYVLNVVRGLA